MPETTVHEDHSSMLWQNEIRPTRKLSHMKAIAKSPRVQRFSDHKLWARILSPDA
jgi:hypothetical protein